MVFRCLLAIQIAVVLAIGCMTVSVQTQIWRCGRELALLRQAKARITEKQRVLDVRLTQVSMPLLLQQRAEMAQVPLIRPQETSIQEAFRQLRQAQGSADVQYAWNSSPRPRLRPD
jgi:tRNA1(Val) A37 N6-methylase TrmN6